MHNKFEQLDELLAKGHYAIVYDSSNKAFTMNLTYQNKGEQKNVILTNNSLEGLFLSAAEIKMPTFGFSCIKSEVCEAISFLGKKLKELTLQWGDNFHLYCLFSATTSFFSSPAGHLSFSLAKSTNEVLIDLYKTYSPQLEKKLPRFFNSKQNDAKEIDK